MFDQTASPFGSRVDPPYGSAVSDGSASTNVPRASCVPRNGRIPAPEGLAGISIRYEDTEEEARYAAFLLYLDAHSA